MAERPVVNLADVPLIDMGHGDKFAAKVGRIGPMIGSTGLGCLLHVVPAGKRAFPFHVHHATHELFYILSGSGEYRYGSNTYPVRAGDILAAPTGGPEKAHQIINTGEEELRYLGFSASPGGPEVIEYPDSKKFVMFSDAPDGSPMKARVKFIGRPETTLEYWDGEG